MPGEAERPSPRAALVLGALALLVIIHLGTYAALPPTPGNMVAFPLGWWGWWDQSQYLRSARAFAARDLRASEHWYPFGYALLGAPFARWSAGHPFLLPDLGCEVAAFFCFLAFARRAACVAAPVAALLFLLGTTASASVRAVWSEPWNTTLSAALIWALLALAALRRDGPPRPLAAATAGALAAAIVATRPTDALLVAIWGAWFAGSLACAARPAGGRGAAARSLAAFAGGLACVGLPVAALWLAIYGPHPSPYVVASRSMGFAWKALPWRAYLLLSAPRPWFAEGAGLVQRLPWLLPGAAAVVAAPLFLRGRMLLLAAMVTATFVLFCAYVDLIASGLWHYNNVHYFKWTFPGLCLLGWTAARDAIAAGRGRRFACVLLATVLASSFRLLPTPAARGWSRSTAPSRPGSRPISRTTWCGTRPAPSRRSASAPFPHRMAGACSRSTARCAARSRSAAPEAGSTGTGRKARRASGAGRGGRGSPGPGCGEASG